MKGDLATAVQLYNDVLGEVAAQMKNDESEVFPPAPKRRRKHRKMAEEMVESLPVAGDDGEEKKDEEAPEEEGKEEGDGIEGEEGEEEEPEHDEVVDADRREEGNNGRVMSIMTRSLSCFDAAASRVAMLISGNRAFCQSFLVF